MPHYDEIVVYTQYDGKDLRSVTEIIYYDEEGEEQVSQQATDACIDITTCTDQGHDLWTWLQEQVTGRLNAIGITFDRIKFELEGADY